jgi:hypothetical protein
MRLGLLLTLLFLFVMPATAAYKWIAPDGSVSFSDHPPHPDAEKVPLSDTQTFTPAPIKPQKSATKPDAEAEAEAEKKIALYNSVTVSSPAHDATIRDNTGNITVTVAVDPKLRIKQGHKVSIELDGAVVATTTSGQATLSNVDRGSHTLRATIVDREGKILSSSSANTFHLHRASTRH